MYVNSIALNADINALSYRRGRLTRIEFDNNILYVHKLSDDNDIIIHGEIYNKHTDLIFNKDGNFAFLNINELTFGRDSLGTKPLYYSIEDKLSIASDPRALKNPIAVEPGMLYQYKNGLDKIDLNPLRSINPIEDDEEIAKKNILNLLEESVEKRRKRCIIGVSGIDSLILAKIAKERAAIVCMKDSNDYIYAQKIANELDLDILLIEEDTIRSTLKIILKLLPFNDHMNISIGLIFYLLAKYAKEQSYDNIMLGQLADELFGGYARYLSIDKELLNHILYQDVTNSWRVNFLRDEIVTSPFTDLILPYTSLDLVRYVLALRADLKIRNRERKFILKEVAKMLDIDEQLIREKKAVQFSSGIYKTVKKMI